MYAYNGTSIVADIKIQKGQFDYHFTRQCPRCGDEAGWTGKTNQWRGEPVIELGRPNCSCVRCVFNIHWTEESSKVDAPTLHPGALPPA